MIKRNKGILALTSAVTLLPILVGLFLWGSMPETIPVHWNAVGEIDGWGSKSMVVFGLPLFILAVHWVCVIATSLDPKSADIHGKVLHLVLWVCPFVSLLVSTFVYSSALGYDLSIQIIMPLVFGILFLIIGNFMPKCRQNYTVGIKLPWTLDDPENWNRTHRFAGRLWVIGGALIMATAVLGSVILFMVIVVVMALVPVVYSYLFYRKHSAKQ